MINFIDTQGISYPRSGRSLLENTVREYFKIKYDFPIVWYPKGSKEATIKQSGVNFAKNHDFFLQVSKNDRWQYIVQYRNPIRVHVSHAKKRSISIESEFKSSLGMPLWINHMKKWVLDPPKNSMLIDYQTLVEFHYDTIAHVIDFVCGEMIDDDVYLETLEVINAAKTIGGGIEQRNSLEETKDIEQYADFFDEIETSVGHIIEGAYLLPWRESY